MPHKGNLVYAWCHVRLPKLCSLSLTLSQYPEHDARGAAPYLLRHTQTLTTLSLKRCRFSFWAMSPDFLQLFAQHMPNLYSLQVHAKYYSPEKDAQAAWGQSLSHRYVSSSLYDVCNLLLLTEYLKFFLVSLVKR